MDLSRYFNQFREQKNESSLPSHLIPLEIDRWELYRKLVLKRSRKYLIKDKPEFIKYLIGNTLPMSRCFEDHSNRVVGLNPLFDEETSTFPYWERVNQAVRYIGSDVEPSKAEPSVKSELHRALNSYIKALKDLDVNELDSLVVKYESNLQGHRSKVAYKAIEGRRFLKEGEYPMPNERYIPKEE